MGRTVALAVAALLASLATLEVAVRVGGLGVHDFANDQVKYASLLEWDGAGGYFRHRPGTRTELGGVALRFNSLGMRDHEPVVPKPAGTRRLLWLGDSVAYGPGVPEELTFVGRLRTALADRGVDVAVAAVQGWNTEQEARFLAGACDRLAPDVVAVLYVVNDVEPTAQMRDEHPSSGRGTGLARTLVLHSRLFEWGAFVYRTRVQGPDWTQLALWERWRRRREADGPAFAPDDPGWLTSRAALAEIVALAQSRGARPIVFPHHLGEMHLGPLALARLEEFGAETGVPVRDSAPYFAGHDPRALINREGVDLHPNAEGHALLAAGMLAALEDAGLVPGPAAGS